jgi:hypothetical protein
MRSIDHERRFNNTSIISPGAVGPVGDVLLGVRLAQSAPDMPTRWDKDFSGANEIFLGSNVSDGQHRSYDSGGGPARVYDSNWGSGRSFKTNVGWRVEDIVIPDKNVQPFMGGLGNYTWRNKVATVYEALRTGENFLPLPGPFRPADGVVPRAPSVRVTDIIGGDPIFEDSYSRNPHRR